MDADAPELGAAERFAGAAVDADAMLDEGARRLALAALGDAPLWNSAQGLKLFAIALNSGKAEGAAGTSLRRFGEALRAGVARAIDALPPELDARRVAAFCGAASALVLALSTTGPRSATAAQRARAADWIDQTVMLANDLDSAARRGRVERHARTRRQAIIDQLAGRAPEAA
ncbi:hypothetical protein [Xanthobacter flavus]|uniref:hypothetical protein n=1 Tax=Xanthobacter flavus TaxID=281 RepID=UPI00372A6F62